MKVVWYVTPHGYGHLARTCDIIAELLNLDPTTRVVIAGDPSAAFVKSRLPNARVQLRKARLDAGFVQHDAVRGDRDATLHAASKLAAEEPALVESEVSFLRSADADLVVSDIPSIPFKAAARLRIPSVAIGNFSWNWIYEQLAEGDARWNPVIRLYREGYELADLVLRLPFHEPMSAFRRIVDLPVVAKPGLDRRGEIAERANADPDTRWVLIAVSGIAWDADALQRINRIRNTVFFTIRPFAPPGPRFRALDPAWFPFADLVATVDAVLSKPGYGILSECAVNRKPLACVERHDFPEASILVPAIRQFLQHVFIDQTLFYAGDIAPALEALPEAPVPVQSPPVGGGPVAARWLINLANATSARSRP